MNRRSLLRLIGLAPVAGPMAVAAAKAPPQGFGGFPEFVGLARFEPGSTLLVSAVEPQLPCVEHLRIGVTGPLQARDALAEAIKSHDFGAVTFGDLHPDAATDSEPSYLDLYADELQPRGAA